MLQQLREEMTRLVGELETLLRTSDRTTEQTTRMEEVRVRMNTIGPEIDRLIDLEQTVSDARRRLQEPAGYVAARDHGAEPGQQAGGGAGAGNQSALAVADTRSPMERFLASEEYARRGQRGGITDRVEMETLWPQRHRRSVVLDDTGRPVEGQQIRSQGGHQVRALIGSATAPGSALLADVYPEIYRARDRALVMRDVLINAETTSDTITIMRENVFTNNAAEVAEATAVDGTGLTGGVKPESGITFTEESFPVRWIGHWMPITRQMLDDLSFMRTYVEERLTFGIARREDTQFLVGNGTAPNLRGILNTTGIQTADGAYFTANPVQNPGTAMENFNRILRAKRLVRDTAGAQASFVVLNPADYEEFQTIADANDRYYGPGPFSAGLIPTLWGLPVVESEGITAGTSLVGDGTMAAVVDRMEARIYTTDSHADYFIRNIFVILAEERVALPVFRPSAFVAVTLA